MQVGHKWWFTVSTDTAGVPHGGRFGNVDWFEQQANQLGMKLGWSCLKKCFLLYEEERPGKFVCHMRFYNEVARVPIPLTSELWWLMVYAKERHCRTCGQTIRAGLAQIERDERTAEINRKEQEWEYDKEEDVRQMDRFTGRETRPLISIPSVVACREPQGRTRAKGQ